MRRFVQLMLALTLLALLPGSGVAQQPETEIATAQINITALNISFLGTAVTHRTLGTDPIQSLWSFKGMINGKPAEMSGRAEERWTGDGQATITMTEWTTWNSALPKPITKVYVVHQVNEKLVYVNNIPFATNGWLLAPGKANHPDPSLPSDAPGPNNRPYIITMPGQGIQPIKELPNTAGDAEASSSPSAAELLFNPYLFMAALIGGGVLLILASRLLRDPRRPQADETRGEEP